MENGVNDSILTGLGEDTYLAQCLTQSKGWLSGLSFLNGFI